MSTIHAQKALLTSGWADNVRLEISGGCIAQIAADSPSRPGDSCAGLVIPGLANSHSHAFQRALAGRTEQRSPAGRDTFWTWRERMYELVRQIDAQDLRVIARQAFVEMLSRGYTSVVEFHYVHKQPGSAAADDAMFQAIRDAAEDAGIRLCYVPVLYERAGFESPQADTAQEQFVMEPDAFIEHYARARENSNALRSTGIGAHSIRAVSETSLAKIAEVAKHSNVPFHIHIAEQQAEVEQSLAHYQRRPVQWLLETFSVDASWCLVHATHVDADEIRQMAQSGAVVCVCPSTEANLGDGIFPLAAYLSDEGSIAIGSDSNITINAFEELRWLEYAQRLKSKTRNVASLRDRHVGHELFHRALEGGQRASGEHACGIAKGSPADLLTLNTDDPMLAGHNDDSILDALVFCGFRLPIDAVMVGGEWCMRDGVHLQSETFRQSFAETLKRLN